MKRNPPLPPTVQEKGRVHVGRLRPVAEVRGVASGSGSDEKSVRGRGGGGGGEEGGEVGEGGGTRLRPG